MTGRMAKPKLIKTRPGSTDRTRGMKRPMRCDSCGTTQEFSKMVQFVRRLCTNCKAKQGEVAEGNGARTGTECRATLRAFRG